MSTLGKVSAVLGLGLVAWAVVAFPHLADVETGKTPEYPDLRSPTYSAPAARVARAAEEAIGALPRWTLVGRGSGTGGHSFQVVAGSALPGLEAEVTIKVHRRDGSTEVTVRSRSIHLPWDLGGNARNIRAFAAELDRRLASGR